MKNFKDDRTTIFPSTTRGGKGLPSSLALDSPSVMSKFATPKPTTAIDPFNSCEISLLMMLVMPVSKMEI